MQPTYQFNRLTDTLWEIPRQGGMRVPGRIYATAAMLETIRNDNATEQVANVAHLPGIVKYSLAMPDIHWGYGFPIGGVAAFNLDDGVISPGGVGYDINCGVRLMTCRLNRQQVQTKMKALVAALFHHVPTGVGSTGKLRLNRHEQRQVVLQGASWAVQEGYGVPDDLDYIEEHGSFSGSDPDKVSTKAFERGAEQLGTLGSGNHFLEVGYVSEIYDREAARVMGLELDQITIIIHCGSRGFGHQICEDYLTVMNKAVKKYGIELPDRQLCCAPISSPEGQDYLRAMRCAVNFAFDNRQVIAAWTQKAFGETLHLKPGDLAMRTIYEVAHNIAKFETHQVDGKPTKLCVHRKGATRAFAPGAEGIPVRYREIGQPVLIPGDMGRYSYVLVGAPGAMEDTFGSTCHGAGRALSRNKAQKVAAGRSILHELEACGIHVQASSKRTVNEEIPEAYKDVATVVDTCHRAGISRKVAQLRPLGCIKG